MSKLLRLIREWNRADFSIPVYAQICEIVDDTEIEDRVKELLFRVRYRKLDRLGKVVHLGPNSEFVL